MYKNIIAGLLSIGYFLLSAFAVFSAPVKELNNNSFSKVYQSETLYYTNAKVVKLEKIDGHLYGFDYDGNNLGKYTGWTKSSKGRRYYIDGKYIKGWQDVKNRTYYFDGNGYLLTGEQVIDNKVYHFDEKGRWDGKKPMKLIEITVVEQKSQKTYVSITGGRSWEANEIPPVYITLDESSYKKDSAKIQYTFHNDCDQEIETGVDFALLRKDQNKWVNSLPEDIVFDGDGLLVKSHSSSNFSVNLSKLNLKEGEYKIIKNAHFRYPQPRETPDDFTFEIIINII